MFILTPEQLEEIKTIIGKHHAALILKLVGVEALTDAEKSLLDEDEPEELDTIKQSYLFGVAQAQQKATYETSYDAFRSWVQKNPAPLSDPQKMAITAAQQQAGTHIRHLGAKVIQKLDGEVFEEDAKARQKLMRKVQDETAQNIAKRESIGALKKKLQDSVGDFNRDWNRVAITEKVNAMNQGVADDYAEKHDDPWVYKQPMPDACKHCIRLHLGPDGHPYVFRLSALQGNGTNVGVKVANWKAVVGATHPHCQCQLIRMPDGWGFDADGDMVPGGKFGNFNGKPSPVQKSWELGGEVTFEDGEVERPIRYCVKCEGEPMEKARVSASAAASGSPTGDRIATGSGINLVIGMQNPFHHLQASDHRVAWTPQELASEDVREEQRGERKFVVRKDREVYHRVPGVDWAENVHPIDAPAQVDQALTALKDIPINRMFLEEEVARRIDRVRPNYVDPGRAHRDIGFQIPHSEELEHRIEVTRRAAMNKGGPYRGPRGGLWADPEHTKPWKERAGVIKVDNRTVHAIAKRLMKQEDTDEQGNIDPMLLVGRGVRMKSAEGPVTIRTIQGSGDTIEAELSVYTDGKKVIDVQLPKEMMKEATFAARLRSVVAHELTHALDPGLKAAMAQKRTVETGHDGSDKGFSAYVNNPLELAAHTQEVYRDLNHRGAVRTVVEGQTPVQWATQNSSVWNEIKGDLNPKNRQKMLKLIAGWHQSHKEGTSKPFIKAIKRTPVPKETNS